MDLLAITGQVGDTGVVICGSERLARDLRIRLLMARAAAGRVERFGLTVTTWQRWLSDSWALLFDHRQLLHPVQELALFKRAIDESPAADNMISTTSAARLARQAFRASRQHALPDDPSHYGYSDDAAAFRQWVGAVQDAMAVDGWISDVDLVPVVAEALADGRLPRPSGFAFVGFLELLPQQAAFVDGARALGISVQVDPLPASDRSVAPVVARSLRDECGLVADRVAEILGPFAGQGEGAPRIGILVPDFAGYRADLHQALVERVSPAEALPVGVNSGTRGGVPWDFSGGVALGDYDLIALALDVLRLGADGCDVPTVSRVLLSGRLAESLSDRAGRAAVDLAVRRNGVSGRSLPELERTAAPYSPAFSQQVSRLSEARSLANVAEGELRPSEWVSVFDAELRSVGWPTVGELTSVDFQVVDAWRGAMMTFASLDRLLGSMGRARAFMWLREIVATTQYQPRREWLTPVQVMTYRDALGIEFDYLFVLGLDASVMPAPAAANPFLPHHLVVASRIEGSNPDVSLEHARQMLGYFRGCARETTVSYPALGQDGLPRSPCALVPELGAHEPVTVPASSFMETFEVGVPERHVLIPESGFPALAPAEVAAITGGVAIIAAAAQSPWLAQMRFRLGLKEFPKVLVGLDHRVQGNFLHAILQRFWEGTRTSTNLRAMSDEERSAALVSVATDVIGEGRIIPVSRYGARLVAMEKRRVASLLLSWLALEAKRTEPFEVIAAEMPAEAVLGGLPLKVVIDRIDRVDTEFGPRHLLVDYKSKTTVSPREWNTDRLTEPQLPIYSAVVGANGLGISTVDGIGFGHVVTDPDFYVRTSWAMAVLDKPVRGSDWEANSVAWDSQQRAWRERLADLAESFVGGAGEHNFGLRPDQGYFEDLVPLLVQADQ